MHKSKTFIALVLTLVMLFSCVSALAVPGAAAQENTAAQDNTVCSSPLAAAAQGELIVSFSQDVSDKKIEKTVSAQDAELEDICTLGTLKLAQVSVESDMAQTAEALAKNRYVQSVQPNYQYTLYEDDPYLGDEVYAQGQYQFGATRALEAWTNLESGTHAQTTVAVVDTGIDLNHEDLQANVVKQDGKYAHFGYGFLEMAEDDYDEEDGHGTHVSGIIGATYGNGLGGSGIASGHANDLIHLMTVSASVDGMGLYTIDICRAIEYAVLHGARVINMSFGMNGRDLVMENVIKTAYYTNDVVFVAASGNEDYSGYSSPSDLKEVISVNASAADGLPAYYSNYGVEKDILAPGTHVMSTLPGDDYGFMSGTSMATPVVTGIAALVLDANPDLTAKQVYNILCASAKQPATVKTLFNGNTGFGLVDAAAAVEAAKAAKAETQVDDIYMKSAEIFVNVDATYGAEALVKPATALADITWSVEDESIAAIDPATGYVTGVKEGQTTITATAGGKSVSQKVTVKPTIGVQDIRVRNIPTEMAVDEYRYLSVTVLPTSATFTDWYISSSNPKVLGAFEGGELVAFSAGTATVSISDCDGKVYKEFTVTVKPAAYDVIFTKQTSWVKLGKSFTFEATCIDENQGTVVANADIIYSSSNKKIFTIDAETGVLTPVALGSAYVIAYNEASDNFVARLVTIVKTDYKGAADYALKQTKRTKDSVSFSWNKIPLASGYVIYRKDTLNSAWKQVAKVGAVTTGFRQIKLQAGKVYYYCVKAVYKEDGVEKSCSLSNLLIATTTPNYGLKQSAKTKTSITIKWNKVPAASGYAVQYRVSKTAVWRTAKVVGAKTLTFKQAKLKAGRTVYYRVLATYKAGTATRYFEASPAITARTAK